jgi:3',5'-nucleoside bisphosphate phosphatase
MLRWYTADLHVHTVLSPCAELSMGPRDIVDRAIATKIDIIAVTDHNSAENVSAVIQAAKNTSLTVIPGMEVYVREGAHMICLFPTLDADLEFQDFIYSHLPEGKHEPDMFGPQLICDEDENIVGENERLLSLPTNAPVELVANKVKELDGIIYPAHIDRQSYSIIRILGFIPDNLTINAVEIALDYEKAVDQYRFLKGGKYSVIRASDAHDIDQLGNKLTYLNIEKPLFEELKKAIEKSDGRKTALNVE